MAALWLSLVERRWLEIAARSACPSMTSAERVALIDAAMCSHGAAAYLNVMQKTFELSGRKGDAVAAAVLRTLIEAGEIETVIQMRAEGRGDRGTALLNPDIGL